jgi:hypothetical protein
MGNRDDSSFPELEIQRMSNTPKTDAEEYLDGDVGGESVVKADFARQLERRVRELEDKIHAHNHGCLLSCGKTTTLANVKENRRCDSRRDCPDCPKDWMIE